MSRRRPRTSGDTQLRDGRVVALAALMTDLLRTFRFDRQRAFRALSLGPRVHEITAWRVAHRFFVLSF
jgi:hypothetical protein